MNKKTIRWIFGTIFGLVLLWAIMFAFTNKDELFKNEITVEYSTGCKEKYVDGILVTPECPKPQQQPFGGNSQWTMNLNLSPNQSLT